MTDPQTIVYGSQIQKWTDDIQMLMKQKESLVEENKRLNHEIKALRLQSDTYFDEWQENKKENAELKSIIEDFNSFINYKLSVHPGNDTYMSFKAKLNKLNNK